MSRMDRIVPGHGLSARAEALAKRHALIDRYLADEMRRPLPNDAVLRNLKRRKLQLKDEIARIDEVEERLARWSARNATRR